MNITTAFRNLPMFCALLLFAAGLAVMIGGDDVSSLVVEPLFNEGEGGIPICIEFGEQENQAMVSDGSGGVIIVWEDSRDDSDDDIYAQRVDPYGNVLWQRNGVRITSEGSDVRQPQVLEDGYGGVFIVWQDGGLHTPGIFAQRIDGNGSLLWDPQGIPICTAENSQSRPVMATDGSGGFIASWYDRRSGVDDIYAQRVDLAGNMLWDDNGTVVCGADGSQRNHEMVPDGSGGAIIAWEDSRVVGYDIYAQRIDGNCDLQWPTDGVPICTASTAQDNLAISQDGDGGAIITWEDGRNGNDDIYSQRVDAEGIVQWEVDGVPVCTAVSSQRGPINVETGDGGIFVTWYDRRSGNYDIYAQRLDGSGAIQWEENGTAVCTVDTSQYVESAIPDWNDGVIIAWEDYRGDSKDIYLQRLDADGNALWGVNGTLFCGEDQDQGDPVIFMDSQSGVFVAWQDDRIGEYDIFLDRMGTIITSRDPTLTVEEDSAYSFDMSSCDDENVSWSLETGPAWLHLDISTGLLSGTPDNEEVEIHSVEVRIEDDLGIWDQLSFELTVENTDPVINTADYPVVAPQDDEYLYDFNCTDDGQGAIAWELNTSASWLEMNTTSGELNGTPTNDEVGVYWVRITVDDGNGGSDMEFFELEVVDRNDDPVLTTDELPDAAEDVPYAFILFASDPDPVDDSLTWGMETDSTWFLLNSSTGMLSGLPGNDDVGTHWINITVGDGRGGSDRSNLSIVVLNVNDAPVITTENIDPSGQDETYNFTLDGYDPDPTNDTLLWSLEPEGLWVTIDPSSGSLSGTPTNDDVGITAVIVTLTDDNGGSTSVEFAIEVVNLNDDPVILDFTKPVVRGGEMFVLELEAFDPDGNAVSWSLDTDAEWLAITDDGTIFGIAEEGTYRINITISDGRNGEYTISFEIEVGPSDGQGADDDDGSSASIALIIISAVIVVLAVIIALIIFLLSGKRGVGKDKGWGDEE